MKVIALCLLLAGCHHTGPLKGSGDAAPAPYGFMVYCQQNPDRAECGGAK